MSNTTISIYLDETVKGNTFFHGITEYEINKGELFKYAVMMGEVPGHVKESDFDYLQSKVPYLEGWLSDWVELTADAIINLSNDDRNKKNVSEAIGVGTGLKYAAKLLKTNPNKFKKIGAPKEGKYLDYATNMEAREFEIETKGTVSANYNAQKADILKKKKDQKKDVYLRFGTIMMIKNGPSAEKSQCVIVDDPPNEVPPVPETTFDVQLYNYAALFSYILDSKYYNKYITPVLKGKRNKVRVNKNKFFAQYVFEGKTYLGECFDYRLVREVVDSILAEAGNSSLSPFALITQKIGRTKFFVGLEEPVIDAINKKNSDFLNLYNSPERFISELSAYKCLNRDGILIIKSTYGNDRQLEGIFTEEEVERRLGLYSNFIRGVAHQCKAPCRSKGIVGKPCEIMTYREHCHFHR